MRIRTAEDIYNDALEFPRNEQNAYVARECARDAVLEREVLELLSVAAHNPDLLAPLDADAREIPERLGKYRIVKEIGRGAMGQVYLAEDLDLRRQVALKLLPDHLANPRGVKWLRREAAILSQMETSRIAILYNIEESDGFHFMTMQYVAGQTLAERLQDGPLPVTEALQVCLHIAEALKRAHEKGIIHRDLKPLNVMITEDGSAKILDFGIAMVKEFPVPAATGKATAPPAGNTGISCFLGTPDYMSPEQLRGEPIDRRTDIWALGSILYECLPGRQAFNRNPDQPSGVQRSPDWSCLPKKLSPAIRQLLRRCLAEDR
ncbi:MAG: serine/threonine protein kinase, partial [Candidatus Eisenbacteria sp.]|nr:serine/threonine protein kinase [Candidatus Eisenbacteria bacterium]